ncbi:peptidyl-prolyl cis-trans isomerase [Bacillus sp. AK128]
MNNKAIWVIVFTLVVTNCLTIGMWLNGSQERVSEPAEVATATVTDEVVATIGDQNITQQEWLHQLEKLYGKETLKDIINHEVIYQLAEQYNITVSDEVVEQELAIIKAMYNSIDHEKISDEEDLKNQIEYNILLEEMLTRDVTIPAEDVQKFYDENQSLYDIPTTYHLSHIRVGTEEEAETVIKELDNGSNFSVLAMERSIDEFTSNQGGDLGYVTMESGYIPEEYEAVLSDLAKDEWKGPVKVGDEFAILFLHEVEEGKKYSFEDVKDHIHRQLALGQIEGKVTAEHFWNEVEVDWFYDNQNN